MTVNNIFVGDSLRVRGILLTNPQSGMSGKMTDRGIVMLAAMLPNRYHSKTLAYSNV